MYSFIQNRNILKQISVLLISQFNQSLLCKIITECKNMFIELLYISSG